MEENTLQVHISALRKTLSSGLIVTVHGRGYKYGGPRPTPVNTASQVSSQVPRLAPLAIAPTDSRPVIAVLPFTNLSADAGQDYFSDGITEDIIVELSRYRPLTVISRHSSSYFKGTSVDIREAGQRLGATYIVEGSVRRIGSNIRITAQLLEAATAANIWAERYDRRFANLFSVQDDLVHRLVSTITGQVERHADGLSRAKPTESLDAYDFWLRAMYSFPLWTPEGNRACQHLVEEAIKRDASFARAHASLAFCHLRMSMMMPGSPDIAMLEQAALRSAERAVHLDPSEARAHNAVGWSQMFLRDFDRAKSAFAMAAMLNPSDGTTCLDRALALAILGDRAAADDAAELAAALYPLGGDWYCNVRAIVHCLARRHEAAEEFFAVGPKDWPDLAAWHAVNLTYLDRTEQASQMMRHAMELLAAQWCGATPMRHADFIEWFLHNNMLRRSDDQDRVSSALTLIVMQRRPA